MSEPPPPPQLSPDGKFYWDGQAWQPMPSAAAPPPPTPVATTPIGSQKKTFGFLTRMSVKIDDKTIEVQFGIQKVKAPTAAVQSAITRRHRQGLGQRTDLVLVGSGTELGSLELGASNIKAGEEAAEWINGILKEHRSI